MPDALEERIRRLADNRCEYCRLPDSSPYLRHVLDHVIARQHGGKTEFENLALCCLRCNQHKGPNVAGVDPQGSSIVQLFHPRRDSWIEHFRYEGGVLLGLTASGRATVAVLAINTPLRIAARQALIEAGTVL